MLFSQLGIDQNTVAQSQPAGFDPIPAGWYDAHITSFDSAQARSGGMYFKIRYDIDGPSFAGRVIFENVTYQNASPDAMRIGYSTLNNIEIACGLSGRADLDTSDFIGKNVKILVGIRPAQNGYEASNNVKGHKPSGTGMSGAGVGGVGGASQIQTQTQSFPQSQPQPQSFPQSPSPSPAPQPQKVGFAPWDRH